MSKSKSDAPDADPASTNEKSYSQQPDTDYYEPGFFADVKATPAKYARCFSSTPTSTYRPCSAARANHWHLPAS